jgi:deoxycytidine triphosphate deaminase
VIVVEKNLERLVGQFGICDQSLFDGFSLRVSQGNFYFSPIESSVGQKVIYGRSPQVSGLFSEKKEIEQNLILAPGAKVISCSKDMYKMPLGYFGLLQTKGTLARLFVQATCNDGQVEPGFHGYITLEIINMSPWSIEIPVGSDIAQLYLIKCSSEAESGYNGRYAEEAKKGPTLPIFK